MVDQKKFKHGLAARAHFGVIGIDDHTFENFAGARRLQLGPAIHLNQTHPAASEYLEPGMVTEGWYLDADRLRRFQYGGLIVHHDLLSVNGEVDRHDASPEAA
jgi:hypothetical protein